MFIKKYTEYNYVLERVSKYGNELYYTSSKLQDNYDIVIAAVKSDSSALKYASRRLKANHEIIKIAIQKNGIDVGAAIGVFDNFEIIKLAVSNNGYAIKYGSDKLRDNEEIAIVAGCDNIQSLNYASLRIRNNRKVIFTCIKKSKGDIIYKPQFIIKFSDYKCQVNSTWIKTMHHLLKFF